jgi:hypothetical protein
MPYGAIVEIPECFIRPNLFVIHWARISHLSIEPTIAALPSPLLARSDFHVGIYGHAGR